MDGARRASRYRAAHETDALIAKQESQALYGTRDRRNSRRLESSRMSPRTGDDGLDSQTKEAAAKAAVAFVRVRWMAQAILACLIVWLGITAIRLDRMSSANVSDVPLYLCFLPLWILPILFFALASQFASTRVSKRPVGQFGSAMVNFFSLLASTVVLICLVVIFLKVNEVIKSTWMVTITPVWIAVAVVQLFFCFMLPGFMKSEMLHYFFAVFCMVWLFALTVLLSALKMDKELPHLPWSIAFVPAALALLVQVAVGEKNVFDIATRAGVVVQMVVLGLQLDGVIAWWWACVLAPLTIVFVVDLVQVHVGREPETDELIEDIEEAS